MNTEKINTPERQAAVNGLAMVGFVALIVAMLWLALSAASFVPGVADRIGAAAVYLGSIFTPADSTLSVVPSPSASTTISFGEPSSTTSTSTTATSPETPAPSTPAQPTAGAKTSTTVNVDGAGAVALFGLPDLTVQIDVIGYLTIASTDSFVASSTVPAGSRPAIKFTIKNNGTNASGSWRFSAAIPSRGTFLYRSQPQQSLNPGDSIDYTLGFDRANQGANQTISITANFDNAVNESNTNNNTASVTITVGS